MNDASDLNRDYLPSNKRLIKATFAALVIAGILLLVAILPAEYGIDPTGMGQRLGLTSLANTESQNREQADNTVDQDQPTAAIDSPIWTSENLYRTKTITMPLLPNQGAEIKAIMQQGENFVYNWEAKGGKVYFDMHGEERNAGPEEFTSYWESPDKSGASGSLTAPFAGTHGWYWENRGTEPVEINLTVSGFYQELYIP